MLAMLQWQCISHMQFYNEYYNMFAGENQHNGKVML